jgi:hypothetical protein
MLIGPEPTTDRFHVISYGKEEGKVRICFLTVYAALCSEGYKDMSSSLADQ